MNQRDFERDRDHAYKCGVSPVLAGKSAFSNSNGTGTGNSIGQANGCSNNCTGSTERKDWAG